MIHLFILLILNIHSTSASHFKSINYAEELENIQSFFNHPTCQELRFSQKTKNTLPDQLGPYKCAESDSPLFKRTQDINSPVEMNIVSDFAHLKTGDSQNRKKSNMLIEYKDNDLSHLLFGQLTTRGRSRASCRDMPPLKITFDRDNVLSKIIGPTKLKQLSTSPSQVSKEENKYKNLYSYYNEENLARDQFEGFEQQNNLFSNLGKDIDLVTHCGVGSFHATDIGKDSEECFNQKLLLEYYTYKLLGLFHSTLSEVRLAKIHYRDPEGKDVLQYGSPTRYAFFKESKGKLAKRCSMQKGKTDLINQNSEHFFHFQQLFIGNTDYSIERESNVAKLKFNNETHLSPFDFDRADITVVKIPSSAGYVRNDEALAKASQGLGAFLKSSENKIQAIASGLTFLNQKNEMLSLIKQSLLNDSNKEWMQNWIISQMDVVSKFVESERIRDPNLINEIKMKLEQ